MGAPFIMPDGKPLAWYLKHESDDRTPSKKRDKQKGGRAKDQMWEQVASLSRSVDASSEYELAEYRILSGVGHRRRARWFNEKVLRDMAGNLTAADMERQFKPPPFGAPAPSVFSEGVEEAGATWDSFRSINPDKQAKVLQRWADHLEQQAAAQRGRAGARGPEVEALHRWGAVGRSSRAALRRANPHHVLQLEAALLHLLHQPPGSTLELPDLDPYSRLLLHGLCQFHALASSSRPSTSPSSLSSPSLKTVTVTLPAAPPPTKPAPPASPSSPATPAPHSGTTTPPHPAPTSSPSTPVVKLSKPDEAGAAGGITCTDVLLALQQGGAAAPPLTPARLAEYVRTHIHGGSAPPSPRHSC